MESARTIAALATAHGSAALAVIRLSGPDAFPIVNTCVDKGDAFSRAQARTIGLYRLIDLSSGEYIDRATIIKYCGPKSYTGEDMVEIICHGAPCIIERILGRLIDCGASYAEKGEFTRRAFLNGKIELGQAEALPSLIESTSAAQYHSAIKSYFGESNKKLVFWKEIAEEILCDTESAIEFSEEQDVANRNLKSGIQEKIKNLRNDIQSEIKSRETIEKRKECVEIVFAGPPNAGKSTLLNLILGYERSIVFDEAGTTRDAVSEIISLRGIDIKLIDCAGLRPVGKSVEKIGVERSWEHVKNGDIVILVSAADEEIKPEELDVVKMRRETGVLLGIVNKIDVCPGKGKEMFFRANNIAHASISAIQTHMREKIIAFIMESLEKLRPHIEQSTIICSKRQEALAEKMLQSLQSAYECGKDSEELIAYHIKTVLGYLDEYAGKGCPEDILNAIFDRFCIGK